MVHDDLRAAPVRELSPELNLHWYTPGDETWWVAIHELADRYNHATPQLFSDEFADRSLHLPERQCYLLDRGGDPIATATAWSESEGRFAGFGRLHWVAVVPAFQNEGIGAMLVSLTCRRLVELGYSRAFLLTSTRRPAAIHLYQKFGFRIDDNEQHERLSH